MNGTGFVDVRSWVVQITAPVITPAHWASTNQSLLLQVANTSNLCPDNWDKFYKTRNMETKGVKENFEGIFKKLL